MKNLKRYGSIKILAVAMALLMSILFLSPSQLAGGACREALARCSVDAAIAGFFGGIKAGLIFFSGCLVGYSWCLAYYRIG